MTTPDEVIAQRLADGLNVTGAPDPAAFGDVAGAAAPPTEIDLSKAAPANVDTEALLARLAALEAAQAAAAPPVPEPEIIDKRPVISGSAAADVRAAFDALHERLLVIEDKLGL